MNEQRTHSNSDTPLTQPRSRPVRYQLIGADGKKYGKYDTLELLVEEADRLWPGQEQDEDRTGKGWDVQVTRLK